MILMTMTMPSGGYFNLHTDTRLLRIYCRTTITWKLCCSCHTLYHSLGKALLTLFFTRILIARATTFFHVTYGREKKHIFGIFCVLSLLLLLSSSSLLISSTSSSFPYAAHSTRIEKVCLPMIYLKG